MFNSDDYRQQRAHILKLFRDAGANDRQLQTAGRLCDIYAKEKVDDSAGRVGTFTAKMTSPLTSCLVHTELLTPLIEAVIPYLGMATKPVVYGVTGVLSYFFADCMGSTAARGFIKPDASQVGTQVEQIFNADGQQSERIIKALQTLNHIVHKQRKILEVQRDNRWRCGLAGAASAGGFFTEQRWPTTGAMFVTTLQSAMTILPDRPAENATADTATNPSASGLRHRHVRPRGGN